jgi:hypothetical protein
MELTCQVRIALLLVQYPMADLTGQPYFIAVTK